MDQNLKRALLAIRERLELELAEKVATEEALTMPIDQLRAELVAEGVDLEASRRQFNEMLKRMDEKKS